MLTNSTILMSASGARTHRADGGLAEALRRLNSLVRFGMQVRARTSSRTRRTGAGLRQG
jgi:hypothetical protein